MSARMLKKFEKHHKECLAPAAAALEELIRERLRGAPAIPRIDRVAARAKEPKKFVQKALKKENDRLKYSDPMTQIQDQIGARVIVFFPKDIEPVKQRILRYFTPAEQQYKKPKSDFEFGYFGHHFILALPADVVPANIPLAEAPKVFELQVRTLFEHAWSEANHDIAYKAAEPLTSDQNRLLAAASASAWGADRAFQQLFDELSALVSDNVPPARLRRRMAAKRKK